MLDEHPARARRAELSWRPGWIADFLAHAAPRRAGRRSPRSSTLCGRWGDRGLEPISARSRPTRPLPPADRSPRHGRARRRAARVGVGARPRHRLAASASGSSAPTSSPAPHDSRPTAGPRCCSDLGRDRRVAGRRPLADQPLSDLPRASSTEADELYFVPAHGTAPRSAGTCPRGTPSTTPSPARSPTVDGRRRRRPRRPRRRRPGQPPGRALDAPPSTTALVARTGLPLGSVGGHLQVLLGAGLVLAAGRAVRCSTGAPRSATPWLLPRHERSRGVLPQT